METSTLETTSYNAKLILSENYSQNSRKNVFFLDDIERIDESSSDGISEEDRERYFVNKDKKIELKNENKIEKNINSHRGTVLFKTSKLVTNSSGKKFTGRKRKNPFTEDDADKMHDKFAEDNITRKLQVYSMNSVVQYCNEIVSNSDLGVENTSVFKKLSYQFKKNVNNKTFEENKKRTIANLLEIEISEKYTSFSSDSNKKGIEKIKNNEVIKNILSQTYINFFKEVFYKNERKIDLRKYGVEKIIYLSNKVKLYEDMFEGKNVDEKYKNRIEEIIRKKF